MMRPVVLLLLAALAAVPNVSAEPASRATGVSPELQKLLLEIRHADKGQLAVSEEDGRFLRLMVASSGARHALEIGAASGYSAIWIGLGLRESGGKLTTIEYDAQRASEAKANIHRAGLDDVVTVISGDAFKEIPKLQSRVDFVFLDAWKPDYRKFLELVYPRLVKGGLFLAHNVVNKRDEMKEFLTAIEGNADLFTTIVAPSGEGMSVSWKRR